MINPQLISYRRSADSYLRTSHSRTNEDRRGVAQGGPDSRSPRQKGRKARSRPETVNGFHNGAARAGVAA